jgi:signal transduction histidine kinase/ActR/RegA family two-component response regulator
MEMKVNIGRKIKIFILLVALGFICNSFPFSIYLGHKGYWGSFFGFFAIFLLGNVPGAAALILVASAAIFRGDWCYFAVAVVESLAITFAYRGRRLNLPLIDALYWVVLGLWVAVFGSERMGGSFPEALLSANIFASCGITAAAIASLIFDYARASFPLVALRFGTDSEVSFRRIIFEHSLVLALVPLIAFLALTSQSRVLGLSSEVNQRFGTIVSAYGYVSKVWLDEKKSSELAAIASLSSEPNPASHAKDLGFETFSRLLSGIDSGGKISARVLDGSGRIVASSEQRDIPFSVYIPEAGFVSLHGVGSDMNRPGLYLEEGTNFGPGWKAVFTMPLEPLRASVVASGLMISLFTLAVVFVILSVSIFTSKLLVASLEALRREADRFNASGGDMKEGFLWPESRISEVASLSRSFAEAGDLLYRRYQEVQASLAEAAAASHEKERLLAAVSHDIRGPLGSIVDLSMLLGSSIEEPDKRNQLRLIEDTALELLGLLEELLDRAAINAGKFELRSSLFDLRLLFDSVGRAYQGAARAKGLTFNLEWDEKLPRHIVGDRARLFQVLGNLVGNAVKYTDRGGIVLSASSDGTARVHFAIVDTGIGIQPDRLEQVFEPYYRADDDPARPGKGLGLAIVSGIVQAMGGAIEVHSEKGSGSRFEFSLEFSLPGPGAVAIDGSARGGRAARVLLADDTRISRTVTRRMLESAGNEVTEVENGRAAVDAALGGGFDLILLDLGMPVLDGRSAAREIRSRFAAEKPGVRIPRIIALTASISKESGSSVVGDGFDSYIEKPVCPDSLIAAARDAAAAALFARSAGGSPTLTRLIDYEGLLSAYSGSGDFVCNILSVFIEDGSKYIVKIRSIVDGSCGALGDSRPSLMNALHSLVNVMGAGMAHGALSAAQKSERFLLDFSSLSVSTIISSGLDQALSEAEAAIAEARVYLAAPGRPL